VLGGTSAVSANGEKSVRNLNFSVSRISGSDRYATALAICQFYSSDFDGRSAVVATGANFPDALSGGALAARLESPLVLVSQSSAADANSYLKLRGTERIYALGGKSAVPDSVVNVLS